MSQQLIVAASAGLAQLATSFDNLAVLVGVMLSYGVWRPLLSYLLAQAIMLGVVFGVSVPLGETLQVQTGYLGFIPLGLGVWAIISRRSGGNAGREEEDRLGRGSVLLGCVLFLAMSVDSLSVLTPMLADTQSGLRGVGLVGAMVGVGAISGLALFGVRLAVQMSVWARRADLIGPWIMVAAGLYVLSNSATDLM